MPSFSEDFKYNFINMFKKNVSTFRGGNSEITFEDFVKSKGLTMEDDVSDLTEEYLNQRNIEEIPSDIILPEEDFRKVVSKTVGKDLTLDEAYEITLPMAGKQYMADGKNVALLAPIKQDREKLIESAIENEKLGPLVFVNKTVRCVHDLRTNDPNKAMECIATIVIEGGFQDDKVKLKRKADLTINERKYKMKYII